jgi:hypothetical protein
MPLLTAVSTSYKVGEIAAVVALALLLVALVHRMVKRRGQTSESLATHNVATAPVPAADGSSVAPPGWGATPALPAAPVVGSAARGAQVRDGVAAVVVLALLLFGVVKVVDSTDSTHPSVNGAVPASSTPASPAPASPTPGAPAPLT